MECVLQWLDELDDLASVLLFAWHRISPVCLAIGLAAAMLVHAVQRGGAGAVPAAYLLSEIALACVFLWALGGLLTSVLEQRMTPAA